MARQFFVVPLTCIVLFLSISSTLGNDSSSGTFVEKTCNDTTYTNLCLNTLLPKANSINGNSKKATRLAISAILVQIESTSNDLTHLSQQSQLSASEVNECASLVSSSFTGCLDAIQAIDQLGSGNNADNESKRLSMEDDIRRVSRATNTCKANLQSANASDDVVSRVNEVTEPLVELVINGVDLIRHMEF